MPFQAATLFSSTRAIAFGYLVIVWLKAITIGISEIVRLISVTVPNKNAFFLSALNLKLMHKLLCVQEKS